MKDFNMDDYSALKGSTLVKGLAGSEQLRFDSVESATVFFARELDQVKTKTYDKQYPELSAFAVNEDAAGKRWLCRRCTKENRSVSERLDTERDC